MARVLVGYDAMAKTQTLTATDVNGISFTSGKSTPGSTVVQAGVGYEIQPTNNDVRLRVNYDYYGRNNGYSNSMINFNMIVPFK